MQALNRFTVRTTLRTFSRRSSSSEALAKQIERTNQELAKIQEEVRKLAKTVDDVRERLEFPEMFTKTITFVVLCYVGYNRSVDLQDKATQWIRNHSKES
jgi:hypothetical protein